MISTDQVAPSITEKKTLLEPDQEEKLAELYPPFADKIREFVLEARSQGMNVAVFEGLRSMARQKQLYSRGRNASGSVIDRKKIVTNAPSGMSFHNYGLAVDLVFDADEVKPGWQWSWDSKWPWKKLALLGQSHGIEAAYFWLRFFECPHFQMTYGFKERELLAIYNEGGLVKVFEELDKHR